MEYPFKDLMPLDEVLEREGYYKDWTHLDPEVFYSLTQISNFIKTKGYGVDVRLLIAQLAEHFGLKTTQIVDLANLLQDNFDNLEGVTSDFTGNITDLVAQMQVDKDAVIANVTVDSEVILARGGKATLGQRLDETTAQLAQKAHGGDVVFVEDFPHVIPEVDDTQRILRAISFAETSGYKTIQLAGKRYNTSDTISLNNDGMKIIGEKGTVIKITGNKSVIELAGKRNVAEQLEICSNGKTFGNGLYGVLVRGDYSEVRNCFVHDISFTAFFLSASNCTVENCIAEDVGWDCVSNFGENVYFNKAINCKAVRTGRHAFSTDSGTKFISFIDCYAEDVGNPNLAEGHTSYHFEYSDYGQVVNCTSRYTADHPICFAENKGYQIAGVRNEGSSFVIVDGLEVIFDSDFVPMKNERQSWLYSNGGGQTKIINSKFFNYSSVVVSECYLGAAKNELINSTFEGAFTIRQESSGGAFTRLEGLNVYGDGVKTFYLSRWSLESFIIINCQFDNVRYALEGHVVESLIKNNTFKNSFGSINFSEYENNSSKKSTQNTISDNVFSNLQEAITLGWDGHVGLIHNNIFKGTIGIVLKGKSGGQLADWRGNIKGANFANTTLSDVTKFSIDTNLRSQAEKVTAVPLFTGGAGGYLWVSATGTVRFKSTMPTSDGDGITLG